MRPYKINMHHVGGRGGGFPSFPMNSYFRSDMEMWIYDADADCLRHMERYPGGVDHVISAAVAGTDGTADLNVNYDPYTSSLLTPNPDRAGLYYQDETCDYILEDVLKLVKSVPVQTCSLDSLITAHGSQVDYLSLDVQGIEYDLLAGVSDRTLSATVAIMCEISLFQFYSSQKLFDEIVRLLRGKGFFVARFVPHGFEWGTCGSGIGWRGTGFTAHGDVLFFRDASHVVDQGGEPFLTLLKLAYVSMCFGNVSYALECLTAAYKVPPADLATMKCEMGYIGFLDDVYGLYQKSPQICPLRFRHLWSVENSLSRFDVDSAYPVPNRAKVRDAYFAETDLEAFKRVVPELLSAAPTAFEALLRRNGFTALADDVAKRRTKGVRELLAGLGMKLVGPSQAS